MYLDWRPQTSFNYFEQSKQIITDMIPVQSHTSIIWNRNVKHTKNNLNFRSSQSSTMRRRSGRLPSSLSVRNKCFPVLPTIKCAVSDALRSRKGRPHKKGSWWKNLNMRLNITEEFECSIVLVLLQVKSRHFMFICIVQETQINKNNKVIKTMKLRKMNITKSY
jgi:hypothetical protein